MRLKQKLFIEVRVNINGEQAAVSICQGRNSFDLQTGAGASARGVNAAVTEGPVWIDRRGPGVLGPHPGGAAPGRLGSSRGRAGAACSKEAAGSCQ